MPKVNSQKPVAGILTRGQEVVPMPAPATSDPADPWGAADSIRMLLYGASGVGKTTLWATFPSPIVVYLCSGGLRPGELKSVNTPENRKRIKPVIIRSVQHLHEEIENNEGKYPTNVLDHASGFSDLVIKELLGLDEIPLSKAKKAGKGESWSLVSQQQYGQVAVTCKETFRSLLSTSGHVIVVAQERVFGGKEDGLPADTIKPTVGPAMTPAVVGWLAPACDYVTQMFVRAKYKTTKMVQAGQTLEVQTRDKGVEHCLRVMKHDVFLTKFRVPGGVKGEVIVDPTFDKIKAILEGKEVE